MRGLGASCQRRGGDTRGEILCVGQTTRGVVGGHAWREFCFLFGNDYISSSLVGYGWEVGFVSSVFNLGGGGREVLCKVCFLLRPIVQEEIDILIRVCKGFFGSTVLAASD